MRRAGAWITLSGLVALFGGGLFAIADEPKPESKPASAEKPAEEIEKYETLSIRGKIVWLSDALSRRYGIAVDPDAAKFDIALESPDGTLTPIVKDFRGRGFHLDPKLHELDWEMLVRRFPGSPFVQVVRTYAWREGKKFEFDYWCDICAIPMYELKECECCQGPIRFRFREAK